MRIESQPCVEGGRITRKVVVWSIGVIDRGEAAFFRD